MVYCGGGAPALRAVVVRCIDASCVVHVEVRRTHQCRSTVDVDAQHVQQTRYVILV